MWGAGGRAGGLDGARNNWGGAGKPVVAHSQPHSLPAPLCRPHACHPLTPGLQSERNSLQNGLGEARRALAAAREQHERHALEHEAEARAREAAVAESKARELSDLREASLR